jgi:hypothetical protein
LARREDIWDSLAATETDPSCLGERPVVATLNCNHIYPLARTNHSRGAIGAGGYWQIREIGGKLSGFYLMTLLRPRSDAASRKKIAIWGCGMGSEALLKGRSILVVEDDPVIGFELISLFEPVGAQIRAARTWKEAVLAIGQYQNLRSVARPRAPGG